MDIIVRPIITERSMEDVKKNVFTFEVHMRSDKKAIKRAVQTTFGVVVEAAATVTVKGKKKRYGTRRTEIVGTPWKKAMVRLAKGQKIDLFETGAS